MGDRICIRFTNVRGVKSAVLYAHWRGMRLLDDVQLFLSEITNIRPNGVGMPLDRREPEIVMFNFIWWLTKDDTGFTDSSWYLYPDFNCDTGDNGAWEINPETGIVTRH